MYLTGSKNVIPKANLKHSNIVIQCMSQKPKKQSQEIALTLENECLKSTQTLYYNFWASIF